MSAAIHQVLVRFHLNKANTPGYFKLLRYKISQKADGLISLFSTTHQRRRVGICHLFLCGFCTSVSPTGGLTFPSKCSPLIISAAQGKRALLYASMCEQLSPRPPQNLENNTKSPLQSNCFFATFMTQNVLCFVTVFNFQSQSSTLWLFQSLIIKQQRLELLKCMISSNTDNTGAENTKVWRDASTRMTSVWIPPMVRLLTLLLLLLLLLVKVQRSTCWKWLMLISYTSETHFFLLMPKKIWFREVLQIPTLPKKYHYHDMLQQHS